MPPLSNQRWEIFAQSVFSGLSAAVAYRKAYPASKAWKDSAVYPKASGLKKRREVAARIDELRKISEDRAIADKSELAQLLTDMSRGSVRIGGLRQDDLFAGETVVPVHVKDRITAIRTLTKLQGYDKPQRQPEEDSAATGKLPPHLANLSDSELEEEIKKLGD